MAMPHPHPTVLIVDDDDDARDGLAECIRAEGYQVETACDGRDALTKMRAVRPCIVLLDLLMPGMPGYGFRTAQLADEELREIPVVLCSAVHDLPDAAESMGVAAYATKPIAPGRLIALIREHCLK